MVNLGLTILLIGSTIIVYSLDQSVLEGCRCPDVIDPVCGNDGANYKNDICAVTCGGVTSYRRGPCSEQHGQHFSNELSQQQKQHRLQQLALQQQRWKEMQKQIIQQQQQPRQLLQHQEHQQQDKLQQLQNEQLQQQYQFLEQDQQQHFIHIQIQHEQEQQQLQQQQQDKLKQLQDMQQQQQQQQQQLQQRAFGDDVIMRETMDGIDLGEGLEFDKDKDTEQVIQDGPCNCTMEYKPVCGEKFGLWSTYSNACFAKCKRVRQEELVEGECITGRLCNCPRAVSNKTQVCARRLDGTLNDYTNRCFARCDEAFIVDIAPCSARRLKPSWAEINDFYTSTCHCSNFYMPMCGILGGKWRTFLNSCMAYCFKVEIFKNGRCEEYLRCPAELNSTAVGQPEGQSGEYFSGSDLGTDQENTRFMNTTGNLNTTIPANSTTGYPNVSMPSNVTNDQINNTMPSNGTTGYVNNTMLSNTTANVNATISPNATVDILNKTMNTTTKPETGMRKFEKIQQEPGQSADQGHSSLGELIEDQLEKIEKAKDEIKKLTAEVSVQTDNNN